MQAIANEFDCRLLSQKHAPSNADGHVGWTGGLRHRPSMHPGVLGVNGANVVIKSSAAVFKALAACGSEKHTSRYRSQ